LIDRQIGVSRAGLPQFTCFSASGFAGYVLC
jgi:hypothetical protein